MRYVRAALSIIVVIAAGCNAGASHAAREPSTTTAAPLTLQQRAERACRATTPHDALLLNAQPTTVGRVRKLQTVTRTSRPLAHAFPGVPDAAFAAYCWSSPFDSYEFYVAGPNESATKAIVTTGWPSDHPDFAPPIPKPGPPSAGWYM
jgi:hypothetical protein